jgi:hypothetical protein
MGICPYVGIMQRKGLKAKCPTCVTVRKWLKAGDGVGRRQTRHDVTGGAGRFDAFSGERRGKAEEGGIDEICVSRRIGWPIRAITAEERQRESGKGGGLQNNPLRFGVLRNGRGHPGKRQRLHVRAGVTGLTGPVEPAAALDGPCDPHGPSRQRKKSPMLRTS